jgi:glucose/mannose-6-phosphate isomerase
MDALRDILCAFPEQFGKTRLIVGKAKHGAAPKAVVICGMGGSGLAGKVLADLVRPQLAVPVIVWNGYDAPKFTDALYVVVSFSGDTEEALSSFAVALRIAPKNRVAVAAGGGKLFRAAVKKGIPLATFEAGNLTPREGVGYTAHAVFSLLHLFFPGLRERIAFPRNLRSEHMEAGGKEIADALQNRTAVVYSGKALASVAYAWKTYLNETAKLAAFASEIPEANHNEIESFGAGAQTLAGIFLENPGESAAVRKRFTLTKKLLASHGIPVMSVPLEGKTLAERAWNGILAAQWTAYYGAKKTGVNPRETPSIRAFKSAMRKK